MGAIFAWPYIHYTHDTHHFTPAMCIPTHTTVGPYSAVGTGGGAVAPYLEFGRSVNPMLTREADYAHHIANRPPDFHTFLQP